MEILNREIYRLHFLIQREFIGIFLLSGAILSTGDIVVNYIKPCPHGVYIPMGTLGVNRERKHL